jgi:hypothetical protein
MRPRTTGKRVTSCSRCVVTMPARWRSSAGPMSATPSTGPATGSTWWPAATTSRPSSWSRRTGRARRAASTRWPGARTPLLLYFTSGTTSQAQAGRAHPHQLPGGPPVDDVLARPAARRRPPQHLLAGLGQARVELLLRAVDRRGHDLHLQLRTASTPRRCSDSCGARGDDASARRRRCGGCSSTPTCRVGRGRCARSSERRAAQPRGHRAGRQGLGADHPRRLRPDRDDRGRWATRRGSVVKPGSMGRPLPGLPVVLVDPTASGRGCRARARSASTCRPRPLSPDDGYQGDEVRNRRGDGGGHYHTGDVASIDADGYITYVGRTDDVFKASDYKISPFELESVLIEHPAVAEAAVVPAPDEVRWPSPRPTSCSRPAMPPTRTPRARS